MPPAPHFFGVGVPVSQSLEGRAESGDERPCVWRVAGVVGGRRSQSHTYTERDMESVDAGRE